MANYDHNFIKHKSNLGQRKINLPLKLMPASQPRSKTLGRRFTEFFSNSMTQTPGQTQKGVKKCLFETPRMAHDDNFKSNKFQQKIQNEKSSTEKVSQNSTLSFQYEVSNSDSENNKNLGNQKTDRRQDFQTKKQRLQFDESPLLNSNKHNYPSRNQSRYSTWNGRLTSKNTLHAMPGQNPFCSSDQSDIDIPDLESEERENQIDWSVFKTKNSSSGKRMSVVKNNPLGLPKAEAKSSTIKRPSPNSRIFKDTVKQETKGSSSSKGHSKEQTYGDLISFNTPDDFDKSVVPHRFMQYTKEGLKEPESPKLSRCNLPSYRDIEEPKSPTPSKVLNHPTMKKLFAESSKQNTVTNFDHSIVFNEECNGSDHDSTSSFIFNESTIIETCDKPSMLSSSKKRLSKILEESHKHESDNVYGNNRPKIPLQNSSPNFTNSMQKDQYQNAKKMPNIKSDFLNLNMLLSDLSEQKDIVDSKFKEFEKEKEKFNSKWENILRTVEELNSKYTEGTTDVLSLSQNFETLKFKGTSTRRNSGVRVISTKVKKTPLRSNFNSPSISGMLQIKAVKTYSDLRANYSLLKTPVGSTKKKALRKSNCYTPHSLSMCIGNQVRDIFGS